MKRGTRPLKQPLRLILILGAGVLAMSSAAIFIRLAQADGVPSIVIATYRLGIATIALSLPLIAQQGWRDYAKLSRRDVYILIASGVLLGLHFATWVTSLAYTSVASSVVLVTTTPLWIGLLSPLFLGEKTSIPTWIGIVLAMLGGSIIGFGDWTGGGLGSLMGNGLALSGAVLVAGYLMIGRSVRARLRLVPYLWLVYGTAALLLVGWAALRQMPFTGYRPVTYLWLLALGLIPQLIGHSSANYAVRYVSATLVGIATLGEPIGSTLLAMLFLHEWPSIVQIIGGFLILGGIGVASATEERSRKRQQPPGAGPAPATHKNS